MKNQKGSFSKISRITNEVVTKVTVSRQLNVSKSELIKYIT